MRSVACLLFGSGVGSALTAATFYLGSDRKTDFIVVAYVAVSIVSLVLANVLFYVCLWRQCTETREATLLRDLILAGKG